MKTGYVTIRGSKTYYEMDGQGDAIIFLHADTLDTRQWSNQFQYFAKNYQVLSYDIRGFGKSELPHNESYSFSEDLRELMNALAIKNAHLVGLSLGAAILIDFALTYPDKVRSLVLADAGIAGDGFDQVFINNINTIIKLAKAGEIDKTKEAWLHLKIFDFSRKNSKIWTKIQTMVKETSCYRWYGENQPQDINPPAVEQLSNITAPTLILIGEHDIPDFQRKAVLLKEKIQNSQLCNIPNAGHLSNLDNPEEFNRLTGAFLKNLI